MAPVLWEQRFLESPYWNPYLETMPREKLDRWHMERLRLVLHYAYENSPFCRRKFEEAGVRPEDIKTLEDFKRKVPVIDSAYSIKFTYHAGEPGPCALPAMRKQLDEAYGAISSEQLGIQEIDAFAPGCPTREGVHVNEANVFCWSMDPASGEEVPEGEVGENVVTTYVNSAQPLINYRTHDMVQRFHSRPCECGRTWAFFKGVVLGRSDYMVTVRGTNVYQTAVENLIRQVAGVSNYYELVLTRDRSGLDQITVRLEPERGVPGEDYPVLQDRVGQVLYQNIGVRMKVEVVAPGSLPRYELKTKRIIDQRPREVRRLLEREE